mmetsp:Transcript_22996/g.38917  ORF Transcript_22996/g.38917 Transcript_22996/m.38917 type:complete len:87 (+) Transcript_22996:176-436(+)
MRQKYQCFEELNEITNYAVDTEVESSNSKGGTVLPPTSCTAAVPATQPARKAADKLPDECMNSTKKAPAKASPAPHVSCTCAEVAL